MRSLTLLFTALLCFSTLAADPPLNVGKTASDWTLTDKDGNNVSYHADSDGKVTVVLFWASWCPYCKTLMPHLEATYLKYRSKGVKFYAINVFEDGKLDPVEFYNQAGYSMTLLRDGDSVAAQYGVKGTPGLFVIDKDKQVVYKRPAGVSDVMVSQNVDLRIKQALAKSRKK